MRLIVKRGSILFFTILLFLVNCKTVTQEVKVSDHSVKPVDPFIIFLKNRLPLIHSKMTFTDVNRFLEFEKRFNGIITSEGAQGNFSYYYQLKNHELKLVFDYQKDKKGQFLSYQLISMSW